MNLQDAALVFLAESAEHSSVGTLARSAYERMLDGEPVDYRVLDELIGEASGKGVLRALKAKYGPVAFEAVIQPILQEIGRAKPIHSSRPEWHPTPGEDPPAALR
jgi:hypothetical protein